MDDLIITSENETQRIEKSKLVLQAASEYGLSIKTIIFSSVKLNF